MTPNNNLSVLPWYGSIERQNSRKWWVFGRVYPLYTPSGGVLPFQFQIPHSTAPAISSVKLYDGNTNALVRDITSELIAAGLSIKQFANYDIVVYPEVGTAFSAVSNGRYYLVATVNGTDYFSEVFTVVNDISPYLKIEWWDDHDFIMDGTAIVYTEPTFKNVLYLESDIAKPEYPFEEEGETRDGYFFPLKQISEKRYRFSFWAPEYLLDALRFVRMSDYVRITKQGQTYEADSFLISPSWEEEGDLAAVDAEFDTATVAKKIPYFEITPPSPTNYLSVSPMSLVFLATGQSLTVAITSNVAWTLTVPAWVSADKLSGTGNDVVTLTAQANTSGSPNTGYAAFSGAGVSGVNVALSQPIPSAKYLAVSPSTIAFNAAGQYVDVTVTANVPWSLSLPNWGSNQITYSIISGSASGDATVRLTAAANSTGSARSGNVVFTGADVPSVNISLSQAAAITPSISISPTTMNIDYRQRTFYFQITCNGRWECSGSTDSSWLTSNSTGDGNGTATINIVANSGSQRSATLTFRMVDYPTVTCTTTITQGAYEPTITYALEFASGHSSHNFAASGGNFTPTVYGVTYQDGAEISRTQLAASALSFSSSGDNITTRSGLQFLASNLGTTETPAKSQQWSLTWTAHSTATATLNLTQSANIRTVVSFTEDASFPNVPIPAVWSGSGANQAPSQGDSMTINPTMRYTRVDNIEYSSGATDTETHTVDLAGQVTVSGDGLSVSGGGTAYVVTYAQNNTSSSRSGTIILTQTEQNPYYPNYYYSENRAVTQAARGYAIAMMASLTDPDTQVTASYQCTRLSVGANYLSWDSGEFEWTVYTALNPSRGDNVYLNTGLTMVCGYILDLVY